MICLELNPFLGFLSVERILGRLERKSKNISNQEHGSHLSFYFYDPPLLLQEHLLRPNAMHCNVQIRLAAGVGSWETSLESYFICIITFFEGMKKHKWASSHDCRWVWVDLDRVKIMMGVEMRLERNKGENHVLLFRVNFQSDSCSIVDTNTEKRWICKVNVWRYMAEEEMCLWEINA